MRGRGLSKMVRFSAPSVPLHRVEREAAHPKGAEPGEALPPNLGCTRLLCVMTPEKFHSERKQPSAANMKRPDNEEKLS